MPAPAELQKPLSTQLKRLTLQKLNVTTLSPQLSTEIDKRAAEIADRMWDAEISKEGMREARTLLQKTSVTAAVQTRLVDALAGIKTVSQSPDLKNILDENAKMLRAKYDALVKVGFSPTDSFELIKVELAARKSK